MLVALVVAQTWEEVGAREELHHQKHEQVLLLAALLQLAPQACNFQPQLSRLHIPVGRIQAALIQLLLLQVLQLSKLIGVMLLLMPKLL